MTSPSLRPLMTMTLPELTDWVQQTGQPAYRGKQIYQWIYQKGSHSVMAMTDLPKAWRAEYETYPIGRSVIDHCAVAPDQTRKYLLRLGDGLIIETVGIPTSKRLTVCVSSQVGCAMDCNFCATGKGGFTRNLLSHEIVDQVLTVQEDFHERVSNVVFMGMGEPLANLPRVVQAVECLNKVVGIGQRALTLSTVGLPGKIRELAEYQLQVTFAVSLHAPNQTLRQALIPSARHYPLQQLLADCRAYVEKTGRRISFEYVLLAGVNDQPSHAEELAMRLRGFQSHVNLIPYNPISEVDYQRPSTEQINQFAQVLEEHRVAVSVRYSRGVEANAACGQLRASRSEVAASPV
ncbi:MAG: 23S rRNA (adenine(2503)-C(2))-methyltransferase RlmN [Synechocystis sp.]|nr:23S rRNA (adenine(2503)-C(2))-methyltransferase RlmN [Synechocystis sp.]